MIPSKVWMVGSEEKGRKVNKVKQINKKREFTIAQQCRQGNNVFWSILQEKLTIPKNAPNGLGQNVERQNVERKNVKRQTKPIQISRLLIRIDATTNKTTMNWPKRRLIHFKAFRSKLTCPRKKWYVYKVAMVHTPNLSRKIIWIIYRNWYVQVM